MLTETAARPIRNPAATRGRLVDATVRLMLRQGFAATSVDQICEEAGLTKGSFFHHFPTKDAIGREALGAFARMGMDLYAAAWKDPDLDPLGQLDRLIDIMIGFARRPGDPVSCMVGMLSQELSQTNAEIRSACAGHLAAWTEMAEKMLAAAKKRHPPRVDFDPAAVAWMLNSLWQGSMLIAKARQEPEMIVSNLRHGRAYVDSLFTGSAEKPARPRRSQVKAPRHARKNKTR